MKALFVDAWTRRKWGGGSVRHEHSPSRHALFALIGVIAALALVAITVVALGLSRGHTPTAMEAMGSSQSSPAYTQPTQINAAVDTPVVPEVAAVARDGITDEQALDRLARSAADSRKRVALRGQWAAQLASKYVGIVDPQQTTALGSHAFAAPDILAEHLALEKRTSRATVILLDSRTFGERKSFKGKPYWMTFAVSDGFTSQAEVLTWCQEQFPTLKGLQLNNRCLATQLKG